MERNFMKAAKEEAKKSLSDAAYQYFSKGIDDNNCLKGNTQGFERLKIIPSYLSGISSVDTTTTLLGSFKVSFPVGFSPTGLHKLAHPDGELATARAAANLSTCMILSTWSSTCLEDVAAAAPHGLRWFQTYIYKDKNITLEFLRRAEKAGYKAIVLTVDSTISRFKPVGDAMSHLDSSKGKAAEPITHVASLYEFCEVLKLDASWSDIDWIKSVTRLPVIVKSILSVADAKLAAQHNVDGIVISNRGGRQMDSLPSTIDMLPHIVDAVGHRMEVYIDGGIQNGFDAFKALAIGAKAVFVGRPVLWGLAMNGEEGVMKMIGRFREEFRFAMGATGCQEVSRINRSMIQSIDALKAKI